MTLRKQGQLSCDICCASHLSFFYDECTLEEVLEIHKWKECFNRETDEWYHRCDNCSELKE